MALRDANDHFDCDDLIALFDELFIPRFNTRLVRGGEEPIYLPADHQFSSHRILFARGYFASALHEISHWCIAGESRRKLVDFGYWYEPDGRSVAQQKAFEQVEVKPQALEWLLARACGFHFRVSADNLSGEASDSGPFKDKVYQQVLNYLNTEVPERPRLLIERLCEHYQQPLPQSKLFKRQDLD